MMIMEYLLNGHLRDDGKLCGDTEIEEDYEIGWEWLEQDTGPHIAPYTGFRQCLLDPTKNNLEDFFEALFSSHMYTIMAEEMNKYANRKLQRGKFFYIIFIYTKNILFSTLRLLLTRRTLFFIVDDFSHSFAKKQIPVKKFEIYLPKFLQNKNKILVTVLPKPKIPDIFFTIFLQKQNIPVTHLQK